MNALHVHFTKTYQAFLYIFAILLNQRHFYFLIYKVLKITTSLTLTKAKNIYDLKYWECHGEKKAQNDLNSFFSQGNFSSHIWYNRYPPNNALN